MGPRFRGGDYFRSSLSLQRPEPGAIDAVLPPPDPAALGAPGAALRDSVAPAAGEQHQGALLRPVGRGRLPAHQGAQAARERLALAQREYPGLWHAPLAE